MCAAGTIKIRLPERDVAIGAGSVGPGEVTFAVTSTHAFQPEGNGNEVAGADGLLRGSGTELTVALSERRYEICCPIDGHAENGRKAGGKVSPDGLQVAGEGSA